MPPRRSKAADTAAAKQPESATASPVSTKAASRRSRKSEKHEDDGEEDALSVVERKTTKVVKKALPAQPSLSDEKRPKLPVWAQFPLATTLSFAMASLGYSLLGEFTKGELASVSRSQDTWGEVAVLAGWRVIELATGWFGNLDSLDVAALDLLSHGPSLYLLTIFYGLSPITAVSSLLVDIASAAVPFYLLRPLSAVHTPNAKLPNRELVDVGLQIYTTALSAGIYTVTIVLGLRLLLPRFLVMYFAGIPTVLPAYAASFVRLLPVAVLFGFAASSFIYTPFATTTKAKEDDQIGKFDPAAATLGETVAWNFLGYTAKTKVIVRRTAVVAFVTACNTYLACTMTIYGIASTGAVAYAALWVTAALCSGLGLGYVGGE